LQKIYDLFIHRSIHPSCLDELSLLLIIFRSVDHGKAE
jgi:hypothetical protein